MKKLSRVVAVLLVPTLALSLSACSSNGSSSATSSTSNVASTIPEVMATDPNAQVVVVSGSNEEMGEQYALQCPDLIYRNVNILKSKIVAQYGEELTKSDMQVWSYYADKYDPGFRGWMQGMQKGLKTAGYNLSYEDLLIGTVYSGEMWCRPEIDQPYPEETGIQLKESAVQAARTDIHSCTAFAAEDEATPTGDPIVGVTKMITAEKVNSIVLVAFPEEGNSFIANPMAGSISENAGINSKGFSWVFTAQWGEPIWGVPNEISFHYMDQYCNSTDDAVEFLDSIPRASVTGAFLMTNKDGGILSYESLSNVSATRTPGDAGESGTFLAQTNHLVNPSLQEYNAPDSATGSSGDRYATMLSYLQSAVESGGITLDTAKHAFRSDDWCDIETGKWTYNDPGSESVNDNTGSLAQAVFLPVKMTAFFEVGTPDGIGLPSKATGEFLQLTLADSILAISDSADQISQGYYWDARNAYVKKLNSNDPKLTDEVQAEVREMLDVAAEELEYGMDRAAFANLALSNGQTKIDQMKLWGEALSHFSKSQMHSQMASTKLANL